MKFDPEFKRAISLLSPAEKDKLIFRLLKYDLDLANRLFFELLSTDTVQGRRAKVEGFIKSRVQQITATFYSPGYMMVDMRDLSGCITEHVKITKDKYGEASLNLLMLNEIMQYNTRNVLPFSADKSYTYHLYVVARAFKILVLINALHRDYLVEFEEALQQLGTLMAQDPILLQRARQNGFDVNWLHTAHIPDNIASILKQVRAQGLLK